MFYTTNVWARALTVVEGIRYGSVPILQTKQKNGMTLFYLTNVEQSQSIKKTGTEVLSSCRYFNQTHPTISIPESRSRLLVQYLQ
jgi:hypothetical protein